jgi:hypothetical protein
MPRETEPSKMANFASAGRNWSDLARSWALGRLRRETVDEIRPNGANEARGRAGRRLATRDELQADDAAIWDDPHGVSTSGSDIDGRTIPEDQVEAVISPAGSGLDAV